MEDAMKKIILTTILALSFTSILSAQIDTVKVTGGTVQGMVTGDITVFKGIPFAAPPVGNLRWQAPAPVPAWTGTRQANAFADACMQPPNSQGNTAPVNEDCLYLNVWTPAKSVDSMIPVLVWIHGGGFSGGSTSIPMYDGMGFAEKGVVFVSLAYRVGPFGFLAHPELSEESGHGSGAFGILDLVKGLEWVNQNIAAFGGDPDNVTIFGHSAGSAAVSFLVASPLTQGLFHKVIGMSGVSFAPLMTSDRGGIGLGIPSLDYAENKGEEFMAKLGVDNVNAARELEALVVQEAVGSGVDAIRFRPVADSYVIDEDLYSLYKAGRFNDTPLLLGHTSDETLSFGPGQAVTPDEFKQQMADQFGAHAAAILAVYPHADDIEAARSTRHVRNETSFTWGMWTWARMQSAHGKGRVYSYYYDHHAPQAEGAGHGSDVAYAFQTLNSRRGEPQPADIQLSGLISDYWVNFTHSGDPNGEGLPEWPAFSETDQKVMVFDSETGSRPVPNLDRLRVFDVYYESLRTH